MSRINKANLKKTLYYLKRNGFGKTWWAVRERLEERKRPPYRWTEPEPAQLEAQRSLWRERNFTVTFSILVPAYRTRPEYLKELMDSLYCQTYPKWELILADATEDGSVEQAVRSFRASAADGRVCPGTVSEDRVRYVPLKHNGGIAENTNQALPYASGDYVGLLDHDDVLTPDALYEMAAVIEEGRRQGRMPRMLYSDEDKCNGDRTEYYEPNFKEDFNLDLLLSNNYICHFLVMEREFIQELKLRPEFDGAQDYDLVLRAAARLGGFGGDEESRGRGKPFYYQDGDIAHIPKVLYHWRCHTGSTAENPESKRYAYEAGRRAVQDFADRAGWRAKAADTAHVGFYRLRYEGSIFDSRPDIGAVGGRVTGAGKKRKCVVGGRMTEEGRILYENLPLSYGGYLHRAALPQDGEAVDIRNIRIRPECRELFRKVTGVSYGTVPGGDMFDRSLLPENCDYIRISLELCRALRKAGYRILYLPEQGTVPE